MLAQSSSIDPARTRAHCFRKIFCDCIKTRQQFANGLSFAEWNLLATSHKRTNVRVVTIKHPPPAIEGLTPDKSMIGKLYDLPPQLAILMIAAGWVRSETRSLVRRHRDRTPPFNRRQTVDRRSVAA